MFFISPQFSLHLLNGVYFSISPRYAHFQVYSVLMQSSRSLNHTDKTGYSIGFNAKQNVLTPPVRLRSVSILAEKAVHGF